MKPTLRTLSAVAVVTTLLILLVAKLSAPKALAQDVPADACSVATLQGGYGFNTLTGFFKPDPDKERFVPDVAAGLVVFDGAGHFTGIYRQKHWKRLGASTKHMQPSSTSSKNR
jgi:hypothetical protein